MKIVYVTGAPASGKSSTLKRLVEADPSIVHFEYGAELTRLIQKRDKSLKDQVELREKSSDIVTPEDVAELDEILIEKAHAARHSSTFLIDSHPVTKEPFGYRVTAFSQEKVVQLKPNVIWLLYASPEVTLSRIRNAPAGRPPISEEEARMHTMLQANIAATYGIMTGAPVYNFDTDRGQSDLVEELLFRLRNE